MDHPLVRIVRCQDHRAFLKVLHTIQAQPVLGGWYFRGQACAESWGLKPTLLRDRSVDSAARFEREVLRSLREDLSRRSLVPDRILEERHQDSLLALAQHYGCKTRLLDWSRSPLVAAYFAASGALEQGGSENFAVFVLSADTRTTNENRVWPSAFGDSRVIEPLHGGNENLAAQTGILVLHDWQCSDFWSGDHAHELLESQVGRDEVLQVLVPRLYRIEAPAKIAMLLLHELRSRGIDAVNIYPGMTGFAQNATDWALANAAIIKNAESGD